MASSRVRVLFVCLGNICRSPLAEGVFLSLVCSRGLEPHYEVDSAGTGSWHTGERPDARSVEVARTNGVELRGSARQVDARDFAEFNYMVAMDGQNLNDLRALVQAHGGDASIRLLREFDPEPGDRQVPDPYYGGSDGFDRVYPMVLRSCEALLDHLEEERTTSPDPG